MRAWLFLLGGLIVWTIHFFGIYAVASILLDTLLSRALVLLLTMLCLGADAASLIRALPRSRGGDAEPDRWNMKLAALGAALSAVAVLWQGLPALLA